jgi:hypothetical protein
MASRLLSILLVVLLLTTAAASQCTPFGFGCPGSGGGGINCGTTPRIGTTHLLCAQPACSTSTSVMLIGVCGGPLTFGPPLACFNCPRCNLDLSLIAFTVVWPGIFCLGLPIPNDARLIGVTFCAQNVCAYPTSRCLCLSNTIQIKLVR